MTSGDNGVDMMRLEMLLNEHFARTDRQLSEMRADFAEMKAENAEFRAQMLKEQAEFQIKIINELHESEMRQQARFEAFEAKQDARFGAFEAKQDARFERLETRFDSLTAQVVELQVSNAGLQHDVQGLYHWDYWLISIILAILVMPHVMTAVKSFAAVVMGMISGALSLFRQKGKID